MLVVDLLWFQIEWNRPVNVAVDEPLFFVTVLPEICLLFCHSVVWYRQLFVKKCANIEKSQNQRKKPNARFFREKSETLAFFVKKAKLSEKSEVSLFSFFRFFHEKRNIEGVVYRCQVNRIK